MGQYEHNCRHTLSVLPAVTDHIYPAVTQRAILITFHNICDPLHHIENK